MKKLINISLVFHSSSKPDQLIKASTSPHHLTCLTLTCLTCLTLPSTAAFLCPFLQSGLSPTEAAKAKTCQFCPQVTSVGGRQKLLLLLIRRQQESSTRDLLGSRAWKKQLVQEDGGRDHG